MNPEELLKYREMFYQVLAKRMHDRIINKGEFDSGIESFFDKGSTLIFTIKTDFCPINIEELKRDIVKLPIDKALDRFTVGLKEDNYKAPSIVVR